MLSGSDAPETTPISSSSQLIEAAQRRTAIPRNETGGVETRELVALVLKDQQTDQRLDAGDEDASRFEFVFIVERDVAQRRGREGGGHRKTPRIVFRIAPRRVGAAIGRAIVSPS